MTDTTTVTSTIDTYLAAYNETDAGVRQTLLEEPGERVALDGDQVRERENLVEVRERKAFPGGGTRRQGPTPHTE